MDKPKFKCSFADECDCNHTKPDYCERCIFYHMIDSGYGRCIVFPTTITVPWCRFVCGQYKKREPVAKL
jgi:hypothetical protein